MEKEVITIAVDKEVKEQFQELTKKMGSNMTVEVNRFIRKYINQNTEG